MKSFIDTMKIKSLGLSTKTNYPVVPFDFKYFSVAISKSKKSATFEGRYIYNNCHFEASVTIMLKEDQDFEIIPSFRSCSADSWPEQTKEEIFQGIVTSPQVLGTVLMLISLQPKEYFNTKVSEHEC